MSLRESELLERAVRKGEWRTKESGKIVLYSEKADVGSFCGKIYRLNMKQLFNEIRLLHRLFSSSSSSFAFASISFFEVFFSSRTVLLKRCIT